MWIGIVFIAMVVFYLAWSLVSGRMRLSMGLYFHLETRVVDRETQPKTFWTLWAIAAAGLLVFTFFFLRTAMG